MNWSAYSRFVGDVFGGPLAMEGLAAFFLESTFLGLWIFGWDRLPKRVHLACIWLVAAGAMLSALFILAANSWMQHPVGYVMNSHGQPELNNIVGAVHEPDVPVGLRPRDPRLARHRRARDARDLRLADPQGARGRVLRLRRADLGDRAAAGDRAADVRRQQARRSRDQIPARQDRRRRGAVGKLPALLVLRVPDRRRQKRSDPVADHPDPAPALGARDRHLQRGGRRAEPAAEAKTKRNTGPATTSPTSSSSTGRCV